MFTAEQFRTKVAESAETIKNTDVPSEIRKIERSMEGYSLLAQNEDWLADNFDKIIRSQDVLCEDEALGERLDSKAVAKIEEHVLRCLGAAVIMQWNTIPTKLQRELFDTAGSLGDVLQTVTLRGQIARFLHSHKDEEMPADSISKPNMTATECSAWQSSSYGAVPLPLPRPAAKSSVLQSTALQDVWRHLPEPVSIQQFNQDKAKCTRMANTAPSTGSPEMKFYLIFSNCMRSAGYEPGSTAIPRPSRQRRTPTRTETG